jgi:hypothetical protein
LNRRDFLSFAAAAAAWPLSGKGAPMAARLELTQETLATMPADFSGLSYESVQLYDPDFFCADNTALVAACRGLGAGVLRLGGNLSDRSLWQGESGDFTSLRQHAAAAHGKTWAEWRLVDPRARARPDGAITPRALRRLRGFLDATGWSLIYGLNFGAGSAERAADEAACVAREAGERLLAFQFGNEVDYYAGNADFRTPAYGFEQYWSGWRQFAQAVRQRTPRAPLAGPDVASNYDWIGQFAQRAGQDVVLLSGHYYAMGPASDPAMNAARLLTPDPRLPRQFAQVHAASAVAGVPFRMTEGNSCYGGGKPGVSDAYAAALWGADYMLKLAANGYAGVNLHGGGIGWYAPIASPAEDSIELRPLYAGMQFAGRFAGFELLRCRLEPSAALNAYAGRMGKTTQLALINLGAEDVAVALDAGLAARGPAQCWKLSGPALDARQGVRFGAAPAVQQDAISVPAYSGLLLAWSG